MNEDFHLEQLKALRLEHDDSLKETRALERYAIVGTGGVWAFLLGTAHQDQDMLVYGWFIPVFFVLAGGLRAFALHWQMKRIDGYIRMAEDYFPLPARDSELPGWEHNKPPAPATGLQLGLVAKLAATFWIALLLLTSAVAWWGWQATAQMHGNAPAWSWPF